MKRFEGKSILVTGAASGIGKATAERFGAEGGRVFCVDVNEKGAAEVAAAIVAAGGDAASHFCDVSSPDSINVVMEAVLARHGKLDVLAHVAGVGGFKKTSDETLESWNRVLSINLTGTFLLNQAAIPHIVKTTGAIINTASVAGLKSHPWSAAYCASKGGVVMLTKAMAVDYGRKGVRINCICPGGVETPIISNFQPPAGTNPAALQRIMPLGRMGKPAEIAGTIAFLASEDATYINGATIVVDGGMIA